MSEAAHVCHLPHQPCGFHCSPAIDDQLGGLPPNNLPPCYHSKYVHYSIDGEMTGCGDCEDLLPAEAGA